MPRTEVLVAVTVAAVVSAIVVPFAGAWGDRIGRGQVFAVGCVILVIGVFPAFALLGTGSIVAVTAVLIVMLGFSYGLPAAPSRRCSPRSSPPAPATPGCRWPSRAAGSTPPA